MYTVTKLKETMNKYGFDFKKMYGQNFLIDANIIHNIVANSKIKENSLVIEIGPGAGALTSELASFAKQVVAFEIDTRLQPLLDEMLEEANNVDIIFEDFLKVDLNKVLEKYEYDYIYVVANLPYYITTPIILKLIEDKTDLEKIVVMVQKEVGNRFKAKPNSKDYSSLSVFLNYYFDVSKVMDVSKQVFIPKPNVDSIVIAFSKKETKLKVDNEKLFFDLVRDAFKQKRKTLKNNLKSYDLDKIESVLKEYNFDLSVRAEQLEQEVFIKIANKLNEE